MNFIASEGCFLETARKFKSTKMPSTAFFERTLGHLGPPATRLHHPEDDIDDAAAISPIFWQGGRLGPVAAAIRLCKNDDRSASVNGILTRSPII